MPKLQGAGWETEPHSIAKQRYFFNGRIMVHGNRDNPERAADSARASSRVTDKINPLKSSILKFRRTRELSLARLSVGQVELKMEAA